MFCNHSLRSCYSTIAIIFALARIQIEYEGKISYSILEKFILSEHISTWCRWNCCKTNRLQSWANVFWERKCKILYTMINSIFFESSHIVWKRISSKEIVYFIRRNKVSKCFIFIFHRIIILALLLSRFHWMKIINKFQAIWDKHMNCSQNQVNRPICSFKKIFTWSNKVFAIIKQKWLTYSEID